MTARVTFDGVIESWHRDEIVITTAYPAARGDEFLMQLRAPSGQLAAWTVGVLTCEPPIGEAAPRYRMTLKASPAPDVAEGHDVPRP